MIEVVLQLILSSSLNHAEWEVFISINYIDNQG